MTARDRAISTLFEDYFTKEDSYDVSSSVESGFVSIDKQMTLLTKSNSSVNTSASSNDHLSKQVNYRWQWRHTVSYWISIGFVLGGLFFVVGACSDIFVDKLSDVDYYTLNHVAFLFGAIAYLFSGYCSYHQVINESTKYRSKYNKNKRIWCILSGKKPVAYWASLSYLVANTITFIPKIPRVLKIEFEEYSVKWYIITRFTMIGVYLGLFMGGFLQLYLNKGWKLRPYKLGWIASWCDGLAGFFLLVQGAVSIWFVDKNDKNYKILKFWLLDLWVLVGCTFYVISAVFYLLMWKLQQFGLANLPQLNRYKHRNPKKLNSILYRDIFFIFLYCVTTAISLFAMVYSLQCEQYRDWIKNFFLIAFMSIALLVVSSFVHKEPDKPPLTYLLWFVRIYMVAITINLIIDIYHISGTQCTKY